LYNPTQNTVFTEAPPPFVTPRKKRSRFGNFLRIILIILVLALIIKAFFIDAFKIPTGSMENTLVVGDNILVNKLAYNFHQFLSHQPISFQYQTPTGEML